MTTVLLTGAAGVVGCHTAPAPPARRPPRAGGGHPPRLFTLPPQAPRAAHPAAQAGARHSLVDPYSYVRRNLMGQVVLLEAARHLGTVEHVVYASSSSVYGGTAKLPFAIEDRPGQPLSLYGATKKADELIVQSYAHLFRLKCTGLRFFTVYGPWGRPDMAAYLFTRPIPAGEPIRLFNPGNLHRDFPYVDATAQD